MKNVLIALITLVGFNITAKAQALPAPVKKAERSMQVLKAADKPKSTATAVPMPKSGIKSTAPVKPFSIAKSKRTTSVVLKKDGTPDKRFNNKSKSMMRPLKKDGTPDKRFRTPKKINY